MPVRLDIDEKQDHDLDEGLLGLIRLGAAWESPDIFFLLQADYGANQLEHPRLLANLRVAELVSQGKTFFVPELKPIFVDPADATYGKSMLHDKPISETIAYYETARVATKASQEHFTDYLEPVPNDGTETVAVFAGSQERA